MRLFYADMACAAIVSIITLALPFCVRYITKNLLAVETPNARKFGFYWPDHFMILDQIISEYREVREEIEHGSDPRKLQEELGDLLHSVISLCLFSGFDVKETLDHIHTKFSRRIALLQELTQRCGLEDLHGQSIDFMLKLWKEVKKIEHA